MACLQKRNHFWLRAFPLLRRFLGPTTCPRATLGEKKAKCQEPCCPDFLPRRFHPCYKQSDGVLSESFRLNRGRRCCRDHFGSARSVFQPASTAAIFFR